MKYALAVEVKLVEIPEAPEPIQFPRPGDDPTAGFIAIANRAFPTPDPMGYHPPAGFDFRKQSTVSVRDFPALAAIIQRFDELMHDIELGSMQVREP